MEQKTNRREFIKKASGAALAGGLAGDSFDKEGRKAVEVETNVKAKEKKYNIYFGDLHNHCSVGYAKG